ncbi:phage portal protein [Lacticaseibacillus paracasei]|uniref:phage portal protein n=1 Tax=Lacticaseibacillus paracasei TaxID=1597 RepID=UPI001CDC4A2E|nr:phage portal protein [Lacticaseibacillus paracasei]
MTTIRIRQNRTIFVRTIDILAALKNSDLYAVVNLLSSDIASANFDVPAPFNTVVDKPNNLISPFNFWQSAVVQMLLTGNAYVAVTRDNNNVPTRLEMAPAAQVVVTLADSSADISYSVNWGDERGTLNYSSANMLHFRLMASGQNGQQYIGISPLESIASQVNIQDYANKLTLSTIKNAINPSTVIKVAEGALSPEEKEATRKAFESANTGDNAGRPMVLDQLYDVQNLAINADVSKFLTSNDWSKTQIGKVFGVPDSYLNGKGDQQSSIDMTKSLYANTLRRYVKPLESEMSAKFGVPVNIDESQAVDADNDLLISQIQKLLSGTTPAITPLLAQQMLQKRGVI